MGRQSLLAGLFRTYGDPKVAEFLRRDFGVERSRLAAEKNAYVLLGKHQHSMAAAWFILAGKRGTLGGQGVVFWVGKGTMFVQGESFGFNCVGGLLAGKGDLVGGVWAPPPLVDMLFSCNGAPCVVHHLPCGKLLARQRKPTTGAALGAALFCATTLYRCFGCQLCC